MIRTLKVRSYSTPRTKCNVCCEKIQSSFFFEELKIRAATTRYTLPFHKLSYVFAKSHPPPFVNALLDVRYSYSVTFLVTFLNLNYIQRESFTCSLIAITYIQAIHSPRKKDYSEKTFRADTVHKMTNELYRRLCKSLQAEPAVCITTAQQESLLATLV